MAAMNKISLDEILSKQNQIKRDLVEYRIKEDKCDDIDICHAIQEDMTIFEAQIAILDWVISILQ